MTVANRGGEKRKVHRLNCNPSTLRWWCSFTLCGWAVKCAISMTSSFNEFQMRKKLSKAELGLIEITGRCSSQLERNSKIKWNFFTFFSSVYSTSLPRYKSNLSSVYPFSERRSNRWRRRCVIIKRSYDEATAMFTLTNFQETSSFLLVQL